MTPAAVARRCREQARAEVRPEAPLDGDLRLDNRHAGLPGDESGDAVVVLVGQQRAGDVDQPSARLDVARPPTPAAPTARRCARQGCARSAATWRPAAAARCRRRCRARRSARRPCGLRGRRAVSRRDGPGRCVSRPVSAGRRSAPAASGRCPWRRSGPCSPSPRRAPASCRRPRRKGRGPVRRASPRPSARRAGCPRPGSRTSPSGSPARPGHSDAGRRRRSPAMRSPSGAKAVSRRAEFRQRLHDLVAVGLEPVDPHVERRAERQRLAFRHPAVAQRRARNAAPAIPARRRGHAPGAAPRSARSISARSPPVSGSGAWRRRRSPVAGRPRPIPSAARWLPAPAPAARRCPSPRRSKAASAARRRRCCRSRRDPPSRRSGATGPSPSAPRPPAGGGSRCRPAPRWRRQAARRESSAERHRPAQRSESRG